MREAPTVSNLRRWISPLLVLAIAHVAQGQVGHIVTWGDVPPFMRPPEGVYKAISVSSEHGLALRPDGTMVGWGSNFFGAATPQPGVFVQVAAGVNHSVALREDGVAVSWGNNDVGQGVTPPGTFVQVSAGYHCSGGVREDGSVHIWGLWEGTPVPKGAYRFVSVGGGGRIAAIRMDGTMATWANAPAAIPGTFLAVNVSCMSSALRTDGTLVTFGECGASNYPAPSGQFRSLNLTSSYPGAIRMDGSLVTWGPDFGNPFFHVTPPGRYSMIATGGECGFAIAACYANCDNSTAEPSLTANDFQCFLNRYAANDPYANCDGSVGAPTLTANDFQCFLNLYAQGCE